jgi:hypothetical protein
MAANQPTPDFDDELLSAYVDNELTPAERAAVEERLRTDERARQTLAELQRAADALKALPARRLGRDLTANIWAAIDSQKSGEPPVLTLPRRDAAGPSGKGRGLIWAALAIAAAIMLMVLRPGAELGDQGSVAKNKEKSDAKAPNDAKEDARDLARVESIRVDAGASGAARQETASAEPQGAAAPTADRSDGVDGAALRPETARSRDYSPSDSELADSGLAEKQASAPRAARGVTASAPAGVGPTKFAAEVQPEADEAIVADAASREQVRTIEVVAPGGAATFERMLAEHRITMIDDTADEFAPLAATASAAVEAKATSAEELEDAQSDRAADGDAVQATAPVAILVEASPAAMAAILAKLEPQAESLYALRGSVGRGAEMDALAGGVAGVDGAATREAGTANNRAWRVPFDSYFDESDALAKIAAAEATPAGARGGRGGGGFGGGGFGGRALEAGEPRERVLFIVRPE